MTAAELVRGRQRQGSEPGLLVQRETQREEAEERERSDPDDCRKRCAREREGEVAGVSSSAHSDEWTAAVRHLLQPKGPTPSAPASTPCDLAGQRSPGETRSGAGDTRAGSGNDLGPAPRKEPAPSSRSRPGDHQRHLDDNPATTVRGGRTGSDSSIGSDSATTTEGGVTDLSVRGARGDHR